jgi:hypothetical protein
MAQLDERFLTVHPRTVLWWKQRKQCAKCRHQLAQPSTRTTKGHLAGGGLTCLATPINDAVTTSCITARDEGRPCGTKAALFEAKELVAA